MKLPIFKTTILFLFILILSLFVMQLCVPPAAQEGSEEQVTAEAEEEPINRELCDRYLSFAYSYYLNQNWKGAIKNYKKMVENGCEEEYAEDIFTYYGRAYQQLASDNPAYYDSALYVYLKGEEYMPNEKYLLKNIAYIYHKQGNINMEIRQYEKLAEQNPEEIAHYSKLVKLYFDAERYEDVLWAVNKILELNPGDDQAVNDRLTAYKKLGKDPIEVQRDAWESNRCVQNGLDYARALRERGNYEKAIEVYKAVSQMDLKNFEAWNQLGGLYYTTGKKEEGLAAYIHIIKNISPQDISIIENIVKGYLDLSEFEKAYEWAEKAVKKDSDSGLAYKLVGEVYYKTAEFCSSSRKVNFEDKLVYQLAYDHYIKAYKRGQRDVKSRIDYLKEYLIPNKEDWFMNRYDASGDRRTDYTPKGKCYSWVTESPE